jgi:rubrerythrin
MKLIGLLDEATALEERIRSCYEILSRLSEDGVSSELKQLASEEKSHANVLKTGKIFVSRKPDAFDQETVSVSRIRAEIKVLADLEAGLTSRKIELARGLKELHGLEKKLERAHLNTALEFKDFSLKKVFEALARADAEHRQRLERLIAQL